MKYYLAEYKYGANLAEFEGEKVGKSYKIDTNTLRELFGMVWISRSKRVLVNDFRFISNDKSEAVDWLISKIENKITKLQREIVEEHKMELKAVLRLRG